MRRRRHRAAALVACVALLLAAVARAEPPGAGLFSVGGHDDDTVTVDADSLTYDREADTLHAKGDVIVTVGGSVLAADEIDIDRKTSKADAEGSVVVEMLNHYRRPLRAGDLVVVMSGLAAFTSRVLTFTHFLFEAETGTLAACAEAVGMKLDQKIRKTMAFTREEQVRLSERQLRLAA